MSGPKKVLWMVVDTDEPQKWNVMDWHLTKREAVESCARANAMPGYAPSCVVVRYEAAQCMSVAQVEPCARAAHSTQAPGKEGER